MAPVVYLHVGAPKTGTSFVQDILWSNREVLAREGVILPGTQHGQFQATADLRELPLARRSAEVAGSWQRLVDEILACTGTVVVSHELLSAASKEQADRAVRSLQPAEVHVVYTARDLQRQVPAEWQQHVKHRARAPMGEFVDHVVDRGPLAEWFWHVQDPAAVLRRWGERLPPERLHLVTVPRPGASLTLLWERFAALIGINPSSCETDNAGINASLGAVEAELLRRVNMSLGDRLPLPGPHNRFVKDELAHRVLPGIGGNTRYGLRPDREPWLVAESQRIVNEIGELKCNVVGNLEELLPEGQLPTGHPDDVTDAAVATAGANALAVLLQRLRQQTLRAETAERRARDERAAVTEAQERLNQTKETATGLQTELDRQQTELDWRRRELDRRRSRPVKQAAIDLSERHGALMVARRCYWRIVNALRA